ncbi:Rossmann-like and DUF2520 domain-containing protein [Rhodohalobacter sp. 614A]|uniref:Rossmann-like and DUF2520 domain-containing protein n=1 Tax=Rhodohalobacter sp. 614A TaxID=2908649 RepID=UPI001F338E8A|nr:Rossmann-like and DUF2520 domain-containing protein [Rhodohalobacter sp. 614A]
MGSSKPSVTIIGTGALGSTLHTFFRDAGYTIRSTWNSKGGLIYSDESGEFYPIHSLIPKKDSETGDFIFITAPDDLILKIAGDLSKHPISWENKIVVHCSGNLTSDELSVLSEKGAKVVSMHPIQTFRKGDGSDRFKNISISLQGDPEAGDKLQPIIEEMGAKYILLDKQQKRILHIAAVMASNYFVALMFSVENLLKDAKLDDGFDALETLLHQTVTNIFEKRPAKALSGPISRGDSESVKTHLKELERKDQESLYKTLGLEALKIAEASGKLSQDQVQQLKTLLSNSSD